MRKDLVWPWFFAYPKRVCRLRGNPRRAIGLCEGSPNQPGMGRRVAAPSATLTFSSIFLRCHLAGRRFHSPVLVTANV